MLSSKGKPKAQDGTLADEQQDGDDDEAARLRRK
jgi:hypothetical protein